MSTRKCCKDNYRVSDKISGKRLDTHLVAGDPHAPVSLVVHCAAIDEPLILMVCLSLHTRAMELPHQAVIPL